jgi:hypothetical protein
MIESLLINDKVDEIKIDDVYEQNKKQELKDVINQIIEHIETKSSDNKDNNNNIVTTINDIKNYDDHSKSGNNKDTIIIDDDEEDEYYKFNVSNLNEDQDQLLSFCRNQYLESTFHNCDQIILFDNSLRNIEYAARRKKDKKLKIASDTQILMVQQEFEQSLALPNSIFSKLNNFVTFEVFSTLPQQVWLSDEVSTAYSILLNDREKNLRILDPTRVRILYLDYLVMNQLEQYHNFGGRHPSIMFNKLKITNYDRIFLYANQNNRHWVLYEISFKDKEIKLYDSYYNNASCYAKLQMELLMHFVTDNIPPNNIDDWHISIQNCQFQRNSCDCGVFMITFSLFLADFPVESVVGINMSRNARIKIAMDISRGYILDPRIPKYYITKSDSDFQYKSYMEDFFLELDNLSLEEKAQKTIFEKDLAIQSLQQELDTVKKELRKLKKATNMNSIDW